jgi:hypothetical protein
MVNLFVQDSLIPYWRVLLELVHYHLQTVLRIVPCIEDPVPVLSVSYYILIQSSCLFAYFTRWKGYASFVKACCIGIKCQDYMSNRELIGALARATITATNSKDISGQ